MLKRFQSSKEILSAQIHAVGALAFLILTSCSDNLHLRLVGSSACREERGNCPMIESVSPLMAKPGSVVTVYGKNFGARTALALDAENITFMAEDESTVSFIMPEGKVGALFLEVRERSKTIALGKASRKIFRLGAYPLITSEPGEVCAGVRYIDADGELQSGSRLCELEDKDKANLRPENIKAGELIGSVMGSFTPNSDAHQDCTSEGEIGCLSSSRFRAVQTSGLSAKILSGQSVAGVSGTAVSEVHTDCTASQQLGCLATASFATMDASGASAAVADLTSAQFNSALTGAASFEFWDSLGNRHQLSGDPNLIASNFLSGTSLFGITGTLDPAPANCASDGESACVVVGPSFAAAATAGLAPKLLNTATLAGVTGNVLLPAAAKVLSGSSFGPTSAPLSGTLSLPLANQVLSGSGAYGDPLAPLTPAYTPDFPPSAQVRASDTVNGSPGTLADCNAGNQSGCVTTASFRSMDLSGAGSASGLTAGNFLASLSAAGSFEFWDASGTRHSRAGDTDLLSGNIKSGITILGVLGTVMGAPANCASDGEDNCLADGGNFAAALQAGAADKILSGQTLGGVAGNVTLPLAAKVLSGTAYGIASNSLSGTLSLPAAANVLTGSGSYGDPGAPLTPSYSPDFPAVGNVHSSETVNGSPGTLADCSAANQTDCVSTASYKSINLASSTVLTDLTAAGFNVTIRTAANFEFWDSTGARHEVSGDSDLTAAKILSGADIFGVAGSAIPAPANCSASGAQACIASGSFYAATACAANASQCFVPSYQASTQPLKAISYDAIEAAKASILPALTLSGIQGTLPNCSAGGSVGCLTTATYRSMNLTAAGTDTGLTAANFATRIATAANSEFWDASGARHSVSGDADLTAGHIKSGVVIHGVTGQYPSSSYPLAANTAAADLTSFASQLKTEGSFEFFDRSGTRYTGSGDGDLLAGSIKSGVAFENLGLTGTYTISCPTGWIKVPGDSAYGTSDFCVMKYEAKNVASVATSQAASTPWVSITQTASITSCRALGTGYDLISNPQWMTIGAHVAGINANWTGGTVGSGSLFAGHNDNSPASACAAPSNDTDFYVETDCTAVSSGDTAEQRRTLTLSGSNVIWDFSGNVWEWVNYINRGDKPGATAAWYEYTAVTGTTTTALKDLVPTNAVKAFWSNTWNSTQWIGQYYPGTNGSGGALLRGGDLGFGSYTGVFAAALNRAPSESTATLSFRCSLVSPNP